MRMAMLQKSADLQLGDTVTFRRFGPYMSRTLMGTVTDVTARHVIVTRASDPKWTLRFDRMWKFRLSDGHEVGYAGEASGYQLDTEGPVGEGS
jgi:hypothetical protein